MLLTGILLGPHMLNLLQDSILSISGELRQMALIVILIKAGLHKFKRSQKSWTPGCDDGFCSSDI